MAGINTSLDDIDLAALKVILFVYIHTRYNRNFASRIQPGSLT